MRSLKYLISFVVPATVLLSLSVGGWGTWLGIIIPFGLFPLLELVMRGTTENHEESEERSLWNDRAYDLQIYSMVPAQYALLGLYLWQVGFGTHTWFEVAGMTASMGMACGTLGINVGHELGHRRKGYEQNMSKALLLTTLYMHFFIEHNRGHHTRVATEEDPASSRYGENIFAFFLRSIPGGWMGAWHLEAERLTKRGERMISWKNEMLRFQVIQVLFTGAIFAGFGPVAGVGFLIASLGGALLLESVNYVEHYGLARKKTEDGRYERVLPIHSWNSNHPVGRLMLFELTRHSDHHANARRPFQVLRHFDESPQLPTGYPGSVLLAWFPPLWFRVMHKRIAKYQDVSAPQSAGLQQSLAA
ncbi:MAG: alkane 1-monooxygenase [Bradymonadia bacterium]|jgi:alkane 1-monooxygenase